MARKDPGRQQTRLWICPAGVQFVFDTTLAAGFSILETQKEFIQRYRRRHHDSHALPLFTSSCPGTAMPRPFLRLSNHTRTERFQFWACSGAGWIRYAERVLGSLVTPHICTARSPQQIMGCLVKDFFCQQQVRGRGLRQSLQVIQTLTFALQ